LTDIDRLCQGRKLIDDTRASKAAARSKKSGEAMQTDLTKLITDRDAQLAALGFNSVAEFVTFNDQMELAGIKRWFQYVKVCDKCAGYKGTPPCALTCDKDSYFNTWTGSDKDYNTLYLQLLSLAKKYPYYSQVNEADITGDSSLTKLVASDKLIAGRKSITVGTIFKAGVCPDEHGFYIQVKMIPEFGYWK
jgi:hypothetical protein